MVKFYVYLSLHKYFENLIHLIGMKRKIDTKFQHVAVIWSFHNHDPCLSHPNYFQPKLEKKGKVNNFTCFAIIPITPMDKQKSESTLLNNLILLYDILLFRSSANSSVCYCPVNKSIPE